MIVVIIGWIGCSDLSVSNDSAQNIEGAFGLKLGEVYEKEVDENYAAAFTPSEPVKPFTSYKLVVVPSTKKICFITASAKFDDYDEAKRHEEVLKRVIAKKYNAKFQEGVSNSSIHEKYIQAIEKVKTREMTQRRLPPEQTVHENPALNLSLEANPLAPISGAGETGTRGQPQQVMHGSEDFARFLMERRQRLMNQSMAPYLPAEQSAESGDRVITIDVYFDDTTNFLGIRLTYGDENLMKSAIEEKKRKKEEKEESEIDVEGL